MLNGISQSASTAQQMPTASGATTSAPSLALPQKDALADSTDPQFGDVLKQIQGKYGAKAEKPREIKKTLGKDDFLRIMITQMRNQDPMQPFKAEQMATEMAQFTSVEQMQNMNQSLAKMANQNNPLERLAMTNLIGKTVTVDRERFPHTEGSPDSLTFVLPKPAKSVKVAIVDEKGETMIEKDLGEMKGGENVFNWDGIRSNTLPAKSGSYSLHVVAMDERGQSLATNPRGKAKVVGVSFEGNEAVFLVGDINRPDKITMRNIIRIDSDGDASAVPGARPLAQTVAAAVPGGEQAEGGEVPAKPAEQAAPAMDGANFFTFKKGEGSTTIDTSKLTPEVQQALKQFESQKAEAEKAEAEESKATGFPSGLSDPEQQGPAAPAAPQAAAQQNQPIAANLNSTNVK